MALKKFATSFKNLMEAIEGKRRMLKTGIMDRQSGIFGAYTLGIEEAIEAMDDAPKHIWNKDADWWREERVHQESISNRLGWLTVINDGTIDRQRLLAITRYR